MYSVKLLNYSKLIVVFAVADNVHAFVAAHVQKYGKRAGVARHRNAVVRRHGACDN
jgi:hypothetical protein